MLNRQNVEVLVKFEELLLAMKSQYNDQKEETIRLEEQLKKIKTNLLHDLVKNDINKMRSTRKHIISVIQGIDSLIERVNMLKENKDAEDSKFTSYLEFLLEGMGQLTEQVV